MATAVEELQKFKCLELFELILSHYAQAEGAPFL